MIERTPAQIRHDFETFDKDKDGNIDYEEFVELLTTLSPRTDRDFFEAGFSLIDDNGDGVINFEEFVSWWRDAELEI